MEQKEIYNALSEIKERTASVETKVNTLIDENKKIDEVKEVATDARSSASSAHKRIDNIDKWMFAIGSTLILAIIGAVLSLIIIQ